MAYVHEVATVVPDWALDQEKVRDMGRRILKGRIPFVEQALRLLTNAGVEQRYLVRDVDEILANDTLTWRNNVFSEASIELGTKLVQDLIDGSGLKPDEIDLIITTSCTGFMIPSLDAFLINHFRMKPSIKRLPITELGCAAGAMALSRAREYLAAYPDHKVVIVSVELPSLTYQTADFRMANIVSAALFGDGGAAVLLSGEPSGCQLLASRTHFFYDTPEYMGFDLSDKGFKIILDKKIPRVIESSFRTLLDDFLGEHNLGQDQLNHMVFHPGGRKIMDTLREVMNLREEELAVSRKVLREVGNLSSASVFWVLSETLRQNPSGYGLMTAFGPGFNTELVLLNFA